MGQGMGSGTSATNGGRNEGGAARRGGFWRARGIWRCGGGDLARVESKAEVSVLRQYRSPEFCAT